MSWELVVVPIIAIGVFLYIRGYIKSDRLGSIRKRRTMHTTTERRPDAVVDAEERSEE